MEKKIALIGPNGTGKTTLIHKLLNDEHVQRSPQLKVGYFAQQLEHLNVNQSILDSCKESSSQSETLIRTVLARFRIQT